MTLSPPLPAARPAKPTLWSRILSGPLRLLARISAHNDTILAAGIAFYALLAVFPAFTVFVSLYGLFFDPHLAAQQVEQVATLIPTEARVLLLDGLTALVTKTTATLNAGLMVGLGLSLWSARAGTASMMSSLNIAYEIPETRGLFAYIGLSLALTLAALVFVVAALTAIAAVPIVLDFLPLTPQTRTTLSLGRWALLMGFAMVAISLLYRFAPAHRRGAPYRTWPGALAASLLWLAASWLFSLYVSAFASYDKVYGSLGAVVVLLLWFWLTSLVILIGAELNSMARPRPASEAVAVSSPS